MKQYRYKKTQRDQRLRRLSYQLGYARQVLDRLDRAAVELTGRKVARSAPLQVVVETSGAESISHEAKDLPQADLVVNSGGGSRPPRQPWRGFDWGPFTKLPNVSKVAITVGDWDKLYKFFGINRREEPTLTFELGHNFSHLRYAWHTVSRLRATKSDQLFWIRARVILARSKVFAVMSLNKSLPRWHREVPLNTVMGILLNALVIGKTLTPEIRYSRTYIEKAGGKWRPLGVPAPQWRVYLGTLNAILVTRLIERVPAWQHGGVPGRGTLTAWREVMVSVVKARYIYEFDLENFFGSVDVARTLERLRNWGVDGAVVSQLGAMATMQPTLPDEQRLDETAEKAKNFWHGTVNQVFTRGIIPSWWKSVTRTPSGGISVVFDEAELARLSAVPKRVVGWPQGANTSPFLAILSLIPAVEAAFARLLMYVDDGLKYSNRKFTPEQVAKYFAELGLTVNLEKSGWVKYGGVWLRPLKFLGLTYDGLLNTLASTTRAGVSLLFDKQDLVGAVKFRSSLTHLSKHQPWRAEGWRKRVAYWLSSPLTKVRTKIELVGDMPMTTVSQFMTSEVQHEYVLYNSATEEFRSYATKSEAFEEKQRVETLYAGYWKVARITPDGIVLSADLSAPTTWDSLVRARVFGWIQARLYEGRWNTNVFQDFSLSAIKQSWVSKRGHKVADEVLDFANSTTFASADIIDLLRFHSRKAWAKSMFSKGTWDLEQWNAWRLSVGLPAVSKTVYRRIKLSSRPKRYSNILPQWHPLWERDFGGMTLHELDQLGMDIRPLIPGSKYCPEKEITGYMEPLYVQDLAPPVEEVWHPAGFKCQRATGLCSGNCPSCPPGPMVRDPTVPPEGLC